MARMEGEPGSGKEGRERGRREGGLERKKRGLSKQILLWANMSLIFDLMMTNNQFIFSSKQQANIKVIKVFNYD